MKLTIQILNQVYDIKKIKYLLENTLKKPFLINKISTIKTSRPNGPNIFLNKIAIDCPITNNNLYTLSLKEILSDKFGILKESYQVYINLIFLIKNFNFNGVLV